MDTEQESLFKAMLNNDWFTKSDGDVESPTGYFGWMVNHPSDWFEGHRVEMRMVFTHVPDVNPILSDQARIKR